MRGNEVRALRRQLPDSSRANAGHDTRAIQDLLGHRSIQHTTRYAQPSAAPSVIGAPIQAASLLPAF